MVKYECFVAFYSVSNSLFRIIGRVSNVVFAARFDYGTHSVADTMDSQRGQPRKVEMHKWMKYDVVGVRETVEQVTDVSPKSRDHLLWHTANIHVLEQ